MERSRNKTIEIYFWLIASGVAAWWACFIVLSMMSERIVNLRLLSMAAIAVVASWLGFMMFLSEEKSSGDTTEAATMGISNFLFSFEGRITLAQLWGYALGYLIAPVCLITLLSERLVAAYGLVMLYPTLAIAVKRCHDRGRSGWFTLVAIIPIVDLWYAVEIAFLPGTKGPNEYGADTRSEFNAEVETPENSDGLSSLVGTPAKCPMCASAATRIFSKQTDEVKRSCDTCGSKWTSRIGDLRIPTA